MKENNKLKLNNLIFNEALHNLSSAIEKNKKNEEVYYDDPILNACQYIGELIGIKFTPSYKTANNINIDERVKYIAQSSKVYVRKITLQPDWWRKDCGHFISFLKDKTPVALIYKNREYILKNPLTKREIKVTKTLAQSLENFGFYFYKPFEDIRINLFQLLKFGFIKENLKEFIRILGIVSLGGVLSIIIPYLIGILFDSVIPESNKLGIIQIVFTIFIISFSLSIFQLTRTVSFLRIAGKLESLLQPAIIDRLLKLPTNFFKNYSAGDLADRAESINIILRYLTSVTIDSIFASVFSSFYLLILFYYSFSLTIFGIITTFLYLIPVLTGYLLIFNYNREYVKLHGKITGLVFQFINGISKIRVFGAEERVFGIWAKEFSNQRKTAFKAGKIVNYIEIFSSTYPILVTTALFALISYSSLNKNFTTGNFIAFNSAFSLFQASIINIFISLTSISEIFPLYERVKPIIKTLPEPNLNSGLSIELKGEIELKNIFFRYSEDSPLVLKNISMKIKKGEFIAIVGPSGSGKSTILRLLLGLEKQTSGTILYDNYDITTLNILSLRNQIGVVLQNSQLIEGDIFKNIIGTSNNTLKSAWEAAKVASIDKEIEEMPMQMFTIINEDASVISSGQKQRLLIARAVLNKPKILLLDEATSFLDNTTQSAVMKNLEKLESTKVIIAHRLSTIVNADYIYVIDRGEIVQHGKFDELLNQEGLFKELVKRQF